MILEQAEFQTAIPATDFDRARSFYEGKLGFKPESIMDAGLTYRFGKGTSVFLHPSSSAGADFTLGGWYVPDLPAAMEELRALGVEFEEYDLPGLKTIDGIADLGQGLSAWFKDSEGNILVVASPK
jgi:catechol 2,3-dioxygenase-like lactoylglutathione lyase family enzyme